MLLGPEWPERALLRAQLIEEGYEVVAIDAWPIPGLSRGPGMKPRVLLIDLHGLPHPRKTLEQAQAVAPPQRVLVVTVLGTLTGVIGAPEVERPDEAADYSDCRSRLRRRHATFCDGPGRPRPRQRTRWRA